MKFRALKIESSLRHRFQCVDTDYMPDHPNLDLQPKQRSSRMPGLPSFPELERETARQRSGQPGSARLKNPGDGKLSDIEGKLAQETYRLRQNLFANEVLFCPISGWDLTPLQLVGDLASVFILADWRFWPEVFEKSIWPDIVAGKYTGLRPANQNSVIAVPDEEMRAISGPSSDLGMFHEPAWVPGVQPWCRVARLTHHVGDQERPLWLVYFVGDCVQIYERLFSNRCIAPKILWLECPLGADIDRWKEFISPDGEFGRVFTRSPCQPKYVAAERYQPGWAQSVPCRQLPTNLPPGKLTLFGVPGALPTQRNSPSRRDQSGCF